MPFIFNPAPLVAVNLALQTSQRRRKRAQQEKKANPCLYCYHRPLLTSKDVAACNQCVDGSCRNKEV